MTDQQSNGKEGRFDEPGEHWVPPPPRPEDRIPAPPASRASRWSVLEPGRRPALFATVVASAFAVFIFVWAALDLVVHPGAGGSWQELIGAVIGNFVFVWIVMMGFSLLIRRLLKKD